MADFHCGTVRLSQLSRNRGQPSYAGVTVVQCLVFSGYEELQQEKIDLLRRHYRMGLLTFSADGVRTSTFPRSLLSQHLIMTKIRMDLVTITSKDPSQYRAHLKGDEGDGSTDSIDNKLANNEHSSIMLQYVLVTLLLVGFGLAGQKRPNILFILTDDQDRHMEAAEHMPYLQDLIVNKGTTYAQHFCTVALCCPSRATLWTGRAAHNHNITNVAPPHGGYPKFVSQGFNDDNLFLWMQQAGYNTYYTGKLYNFHSVDNYDMPYARGFNGSDFLLDPYTYQYRNAKMTHNGEEPVSYAGQYSTDVVASKAKAFLHEGLQHLAAAGDDGGDDQQQRPFFLTVAPIAPHSNWVLEPEKDLSYLLEPMAAPRHQHMFTDYKIPRTKAYNAAIEGSIGWISSLPSLNDTVLAYNDHYQRQRLRALQAVDEMLAELIQQLEDAGELDNTYIFYTTDNGYHISQHRMNPGKECGYDTDIHIPFYLRGPGIDAGGVVDVITTHTDVSSTLLQIAGASKQLDGTAIPLGRSPSGQDWELDEDPPRRHEHATIEYWGYGVPEGLYGGRTDNKREAGKWRNYYLNNTYKGLRLVSQDYSLYYAVWCTNETEFYDLKTDAYQVVNMAADIGAYSSYQIAGRPLAQILPRLDALMMVLKTCRDSVCVHPWRTLHPNGRVADLADALDARFDAFYRAQPKMGFASCPDAYYLEAETQEPVKPWADDARGPKEGVARQPEFDYALHWQLLT
ncbi:uncharacterized protein PV07_00441 [Cladophialophora immunda]|uniref:Sulfatase N-terminal domain-containing protein n=1 Tax=Cladophialophora immunda TaxID=569365 RepID=A0A0D2CUR0_9EURO|nr:uncharacterized protein PV07_00441 [Cladophialophora immunda]KIW33605.1 hypothetical protein PV07_00441 [Cladophialophora immunda]